MAQNKSLSTQEVADILHVSRSTIYELIRRGEINSYKVGRKVRFMQEDVDVYIARSRHEASTKPVRAVETASSFLTGEKQGSSDIVISGQDVVLDILAGHVSERGFSVGRSFLPGFEGLLAMYEGKVDAVSCHLYSADQDEFNVPFVRALAPGVPAVLVNLSYRKQGFYVRRGNPKHICSWEDLARSDVTVLNRRTGSASRILLDGQLRRLGIPAASVNGYDRLMRSHLTMAAAIVEGEADVGIGTSRVSKQMQDIEFIPLIEERYDLVIRRDKFDSAAGRAMLDVMASEAFKKEISHFTGNDYRDLGKIIMEV